MKNVGEPLENQHTGSVALEAFAPCRPRSPAAAEPLDEVSAVHCGGIKHQEC